MMTKDNPSQLKTNENSVQGDAVTGEEAVLTAEDLEKLLGKSVARVEIKNLTAAGENYGSVMLALTVVLKSGETLPLVAKMFPKSEFALKLFQCPLSMRKEIDMYVLVRPEFERIQEECSVASEERLHVLCECPGARLTLGECDEDTLADKDSVLLLENLKLQGYRTVDRVVGLDLQHTEFALKQLARFHATAVAIKLKKPVIFKTKILRACTPFKVVVKSREEEEKSERAFIKKLKKIPICERYIDEIEKLFKKSTDDRYSEQFSTPLEPFATISHNDFWTNNMMFKYSDDTSNNAIDFKIVDFQTCRYESPVPDIILFLFTSTQDGIVEEKLDYFLGIYHDCFLEWLQMLDCDINNFSRESFLKEVDLKASESLHFILFMLRPITLTKEEAEKFTNGPAFDELELGEKYVKRVSNVVSVFAKNGWLQ